MSASPLRRVRTDPRPPIRPIAPAPDPPAKNPPPSDPPGGAPRRHLRAVPNTNPHIGATAFDGSSPDDDPAPEPRLMQMLALYAFEAVEGARAVAQLGGWITAEVAQALSARRAANTERRTICADGRRVIAAPGPVHIGRPHPSVIEATVVLHTERRSRPVALRLERISERWRATAIDLL